ncbi:MAG: Ca-activated chloride channel family protein [Bacteroidia bacterium]|jgi:Ca-activated chloride channel family protein
MVHIGLQGKVVSQDNLPASNLVFLIDASGSMSSSDKLLLLKNAFKILIGQLREQDKIAIVVYAGAAGLVLPSTSGKDKRKILDALDQLQAGGSTASGAGIKLAYKVGMESFKKGENNRVILATDGDFNVGASSDSEMTRLIEEKRKTGIFLTCLGSGNYQDSKMEQLSNKGNGNYAYIDSKKEADKVFAKEFGGTLFTIAKDVKLQVEFNPKKVQAYRLIGYENRLLNDEDFKDDKKNAGELGSGHTVTALYELIPVGVKSQFTKKLPKLKYSKQVANTEIPDNELFHVKFRYKQPDASKSKLIEVSVNDSEQSWKNTSENFRFSASVAAFGMHLRDSKFLEGMSKKSIIALANGAKGKDENGYRKEFVGFVEKVKAL